LTPVTLPPRFVSIKDACAALGISRATFYRLADAGTLETVKLGRRRLVSVAGLDRFEASLLSADGA
jgi:excisionase family DNA binding protein